MTAPDHITSTAPKRIYLDIGDQFALESVTAGSQRWDLLEGVTWSEDNATSHGIPYVRADLVPAKQLTAHFTPAYLLTNGWQMASREYQRGPLWALASSLFAVGSTTAKAICREAGLDPEARGIVRIQNEGAAA